MVYRKVIVKRVLVDLKKKKKKKGKLPFFAEL